MRCTEIHLPVAPPDRGQPMGEFLDTVLAILFAVIFLFGGVYVLWESQGLFRDLFAMLVTRTLPVGEVREGRVEVSGTAQPADRTLTEPIEAGEVLAYEYKVTEERDLKVALIDWTPWGYINQAEGGSRSHSRLRIQPAEYESTLGIRTPNTKPITER